MGPQLKQISAALQGLARSPFILFQPYARRLLYAPILAYSLLLFLAIYYAYHNFHAWFERFKLLFEGSLTLGDSWTWLLSVALQLLLFFTMVSLLKYLSLILLAPFYSTFVQKLIQREGGEAYLQALPGGFLGELWRAARVNLVNFARETGLSLLLFLLAFLPPVAAVAPLGFLLIHAYFMGCAMLDYTQEAWGWSLRESQLWLREHRLLALIIGLWFYLLWLLPLVGWILAPSLAAIAASLAALRLRRYQVE